jgi:hypothetical protein
MQNDPLLPFRIFSGAALAVSIMALVFVMKNSDRFFGIDPNVPSETSSGRTYNRFLVVIALLHAVVLFSTGLFLM